MRDRSAERGEGAPPAGKGVRERLRMDRFPSGNGAEPPPRFAQECPTIRRSDFGAAIINLNKNATAPTYRELLFAPISLSQRSGNLNGTKLLVIEIFAN